MTCMSPAWALLVAVVIHVVIGMHLVVYEEKLNWFIAEYKCALRGGMLVSPNSSQVTDEIIKVSNTSKDYWIGVSLDANGWVFEQGSIVAAGKTYQMWHDYGLKNGEPNFEHTDHCARIIFNKNITTDQYEGTWRTTFCKNLHEYICQFDQEPTTAATTELTTLDITTMSTTTRKLPLCRQKKNAIPVDSHAAPKQHNHKLGFFIVTLGCLMVQSWV